MPAVGSGGKWKWARKRLVRNERQWEMKNEKRTKERKKKHNMKNRSRKQVNQTSQLASDYENWPLAGLEGAESGAWGVERGGHPC